MTIINMTGGSAGETTSVTSLSKSLYCRYSGYATNGTSSRVWRGSYLPDGSTFKVYKTGSTLSIFSSFANSPADAQTMYESTFSLSSTTPTFTTDNIGTYLKSVCPKGKTFTGYVSGVIACNGIVIGYASYYVSGSPTSITYNGSTYGRGFASSATSGQYAVYFYPSSINISYS